jgi:SnoaL-like domain
MAGSSFIERRVMDIQDLLDKQAITEVLMRYCRGVDRMDRATFVGTYWPDATDDHVKYVGGVDGLADFVFAAIAKMRTQHMMGNILIEMRGPTRALCESYVHAYHEADGFFGKEEFVIGARYLDIFEKRDAEWRILHRKVVMDYYKTAAATSDWHSGRYVEGPSRSEKMPDDPLYTFEEKWTATHR